MRGRSAKRESLGTLQPGRGCMSSEFEAGGDGGPVGLQLPDWMSRVRASWLIAGLLFVTPPLSAQTDLLEATAIVHASQAEYDVEATGPLPVCVGTVRPGTSAVDDPTPRVLALAEEMLDRRWPAPWAPGDSITTAQLTPASRCARMQERRGMLAEATEREPTPVRFILLEVVRVDPSGDVHLSARYRGDAEGEFRCSSDRGNARIPYRCTVPDPGTPEAFP